MMRVMSGSDFNLDIEMGMMNAMLTQIADDGLYYSPVKDRPWHGYKEDYANVYGQGRMLLAMMAWCQRDRDPAWKTRIQNMVNGLAKIAIYKDDYAYYPNPGFWESFSYPKSGWTTTEESADHVFGVHMYHCGQVRALARWYAMSGDETALELARKLANYLRKPSLWVPDAVPKTVDGPAHAHYSGHFHAHVASLRALLEYAIVTGEKELKEFCREGYEFSRNFGIARIGMFARLTNDEASYGFPNTQMLSPVVSLAVLRTWWGWR